MNIFEKLYRKVKKKYEKNKNQWGLWCKRKKTMAEREKVIIEAILTQRTNWRNVKLALNNLKKAKINSLKDIHRLGKERLAPLIKPTGFYKAKADYLFNLAKFIIKNYGDLKKMKKLDLYQLRKELLKLKGIGLETADSILLYALDKPIFVIDEYTRRFVKKHNLSNNLSYHYLQQLFQKNLPKNIKLYQDFHALIIIEGQESNRDSLSKI